MFERILELIIALWLPFLMTVYIIFGLIYKNKVYIRLYSSNVLYKKVTYQFLVLSFIFVSCIMGAVILGLFMPEYDSVLNKLFSYVFLYFTILKLFTIYTYFFDKQEEKSLLKRLKVEKYNSINLYSWSGDSTIQDKELSRMLLKETSRSNDLYNLKAIKSGLKKLYGEDVLDYHLMKGFFESYQTNNPLNLSKTIMVPMFVAITTLVLRESKLINKEDTKDETSNLDTLIQFLDVSLIVVFVVVAIIFFINGVTRSKRRLGVIISVIDNIIYEKEKQ
ncbi:hypothetical protein CHH49_04015 [Terribacillus saccharophilus]|uniref:hypothetical protein n=1 Tax=Terribacillus saccharophilus TaxID=361277 RepID=UPI000BA57923|nr:hypothetical protein [Terribacillus saccharophilus]PAF22760.1 hypothetical protein CHH49_04015 [Terribacillus saccharophilus]